MRGLSQAYTRSAPRLANAKSTVTSVIAASTANRAGQWQIAAPADAWIIEDILDHNQTTDQPADTDGDHRNCRQ